MSSTFNNEIYPKFFTEEDHKKTALTKLIDYVIKEHEICAMNIDTTQDLKYLLDMIKSCLDLPSSKSGTVPRLGTWQP